MQKGEERYFKGEKEDIDVAIEIAEKWGYGNVIHTLQNAWADQLMADYDLSPKVAAQAAFMLPSDIKLYVNGKKNV